MSSELAGTDARTRLLEHAARLLGDEGPSALTTRRLATAAGTSTMAVYTHFGGMQALVREVVTQGFARLAAHLAGVPATEDPAADLAMLARAYRDNAHENPHLYGVMFGTVGLGVYRLSAQDRKIGMDTFTALADAVRRVAATHPAHQVDPVDVASQLWSALHGYVTLELAGYHDPGAADRVLWPMLADLVVPLLAQPHVVG